MPAYNLNQRQIEKLLEAFQEIHLKFLKEIPLDRALTGFFRKNSRFGSNDRRRISSTLFGYYRWYGWLRQIPNDRISLALLLGYLLDGNEISTFILNWSKSLGLEAPWLKKFECSQSLNLGDKSQVVGEYVGDNSFGVLVPRFLDPEDEELIEVNQRRAPTWVRVQEWARDEFTSFLERKGVGFETSSVIEGAIKLKKPVNLFESKVFKKGGVEVQDLSSQIVGLICDPQKGDIWWDVCTGSGGKALHLASMMGGQGQIIATDIREQAIRECKKRVRWGGWNNIKAIQREKEKIPKFPRALAGILIDAPCSCSGTWRRSPDLRWSLTEGKILEFARAQLEILTRAAPLLPKNGKLVYATCSLLPQENERVIEKFLEIHPEFELATIKTPWSSRQKPDTGIHLGPPEIDGNFMFVSQMFRKQTR